MGDDISGREEKRSKLSKLYFEARAAFPPADYCHG